MKFLQTFHLHHALSLVLIVATHTVMADKPVAAVKDPKKIFDFWTPSRRKNAISRDLIVKSKADDRRRNLRALAGRPNKPTETEGSADGTVYDGAWDMEGHSSARVNDAAGRLYFVMAGQPSSCSGSVVQDSTQGRSIILTAAHCVYDYKYNVFATEVLFIPRQDDGGKDVTDTNCRNDAYGCWTPSFGVVDERYASKKTWDISPLDYGYYVVNDLQLSGNKDGMNPSTLDTTVVPLPVAFTEPNCDVAAFYGYSVDKDPDFRYCKQPLTKKGSDGYELTGCGLYEGSSGGPLMCWTDSNPGNGPVTSVVSWGTRNSTNHVIAMGGPALHGNTAQCMFEDFAKKVAFESITNGGVIVLNDGTSACKQDPILDGKPLNSSGEKKCLFITPTCEGKCSSMANCCSCVTSVGCAGGSQEFCNGIWV